MADLIEIKGIKSFGYHGVLESEKVTGQDFYVDVVLEVDLTRACVSDDVADTINYAEVTDLVVREITGAPVSLIEKLGNASASSFLSMKNGVDFTMPYIVKSHITKTVTPICQQSVTNGVITIATKDVTRAPRLQRP